MREQFEELLGQLADGENPLQLLREAAGEIQTAQEALALVSEIDVDALLAKLQLHFESPQPLDPDQPQTESPNKPVVVLKILAENCGSCGSPSHNYIQKQADAFCSHCQTGLPSTPIFTIDPQSHQISPASEFITKPPEVIQQPPETDWLPEGYTIDSFTKFGQFTVPVVKDQNGIIRPEWSVNWLNQQANAKNISIDSNSGLQVITLAPTISLSSGNGRSPRRFDLGSVVCGSISTSISGFLTEVTIGPSIVHSFPSEKQSMWIGINTYFSFVDGGDTIPDQDNETRCRKCAYVLRGIREPICSECGERI